MTLPPNLSHYDLLDLPEQAKPEQVREAYLRLSRELASAQGRAGAHYRLECLKHAYQVLSNPELRAEYDAGLRASGIAAAVPLQVQLDLREAGWSPLRKLLTAIAALMLFGMVAQLAVFGLSYHRAKVVTSPEAVQKADDQTYLQDFYQTYGVRMASRVEAEAYLARLKAQEDAERAMNERQRAKADQERKERQFEEESHRIGAEVSSKLRMAEEQAAQRQQSEQEAKEEKARAAEEAERRRVEQQQEQWRAVLSR